jgi:hypothetical protein
MIGYRSTPTMAGLAGLRKGTNPHRGGAYLYQSSDPLPPKWGGGCEVPRLRCQSLSVREKPPPEWGSVCETCWPRLGP